MVSDILEGFEPSSKKFLATPLMMANAGKKKKKIFDAFLTLLLGSMTLVMGHKVHLFVTIYPW